ncbi:MAG TPA: hypothetical protein VL123_04315 [Candidatus Udaeobacter sp.]|jgi:hypothetical protein|nr:hypothetical protein [Candidatus Udaeobacter sp.]
MPSLSLLWKLAALAPAPLDGAWFHRMGLAAMYAGCPAEADRLFERGARRYREEIRVEPLARLRAHQEIARLRSSSHADPGRVLEVERLLYRLRRIESLEPPHALIDAGRLLASWNDDAAGPARPPLELRTARAASASRGR